MIASLPAGKLNVIANQNLGDLDGIERRAFAQVVRYNPEIEAVGDRIILANSADVSGVFTGRIDRHRIDILFRGVGQDDTGRFAQNLFRFRRRKFHHGFYVDGLRVAAKNRHAHSRYGDR